MKVYEQSELGICWYRRIPIRNGWLQLIDNQQIDMQYIEYHKEKPLYQGDDVTPEKVIVITPEEVSNLIEHRIKKIY